MKWPSESLRVTAYTLKKKHGWTDQECYDHFVKIGKITQTVAPPNPRNKPIPPANPPGSVASPRVSLPRDLQLIVDYTQIAQQQVPSWRPSDTIAYLEKSKQIAPPEDTSIKETENYKEIRDDFFTEEYRVESTE